MTNVVVLAPTVEVHGSGERWSDLLARSSRVAKELGADLVTDDSAREALDHGCFTVFYDHEERLALGQPGSGFSPLVVSVVDRFAPSMSPCPSYSVIALGGLRRTFMLNELPSTLHEGTSHEACEALPGKGFLLLDPAFWLRAFYCNGCTSH